MSQDAKARAIAAIRTVIRQTHQGINVGDRDLENVIDAIIEVVNHELNTNSKGSIAIPPQSSE